MKHNYAAVGQGWALLVDCFLQTVQLLKVQVRIKSLAVEDQLIMVK